MYDFGHKPAHSLPCNLFFKLGLRFVQQTAFNSQIAVVLLAPHQTQMDAPIGHRKPGMEWTKDNAWHAALHENMVSQRLCKLRRY